MGGAAIFYICEEIGEARALEGEARGRSIGGAFRSRRASWGELRFLAFVRKLGKGGGRRAGNATWRLSADRTLSRPFDGHRWLCPTSLEAEGERVALRAFWRTQRGMNKKEWGGQASCEVDDDVSAC